MPHSVNTSQSRLLALFAAFAVSAFSFGLGMVLANDGVELILFGLATGSLVIVVTPALTKRNFFVFEPVTFVFVSVLFGLGLKTFYVVLGYSTNIVVSDGLMRNLSLADLQFGAFVLLLGLITFTIGYHVKLPRAGIVRVLARYQFANGRVAFVSLVFVVLSLVAFIGFVATIGFSFGGLEDLSQKRFQGTGYTSATRLESMSYYFYRLSLLSKAPMYILFFLIIKYNLPYTSRYGILFFICLFLNLFVPFFVSNKAGIVIVLADLFIISYGLQCKFNYIKIGIYSALTVFLLALLIDVRGGDSFSDYTVYDKLFGGRYFVGITKTAHIVNAFPQQIEFFHGTTLVGWMNLFLPTDYKFSPDAFTNLAYFLGQNVFGMATNGIPPGIIAEFYLNFGLLGVALGMFLVGMLLYWIHASMYPYLSQGCVLILYAIVVVRVPTFLFNNGVSVALLKTAADVLIVAVFLFLVGRLQTRESGSRGSI